MAALLHRIVGGVGGLPAFLLTVLVGGGVAVLATIAAGGIYDSVSENDDLALIDQPVLDALVALRSPPLVAVAAALAHVFGTIGLPVLAVVAIVVLSLVQRRRTPAIVIAAAGIGSLAMTLAGKPLVGRERPPRSSALPPFESSPSFPSGHTLNSAAVLGAIAYVVVLDVQSRRISGVVVAAAAVLAVGVGLSRIVLGAHWPTDVLVGWALGAAWLAVVITAHRLQRAAGGTA